MLGKVPVFWITGIPASGKTTLARRLVRHFQALGHSAEVVDGDDVRKFISTDLGFSKEDRLLNSRRIAWIARLLARNGVIAIAASVSPYLEGRESARMEAESDGLQFIEIYLRCRVDAALKRDVKRVYSTKDDVTGLGAPYEPPQNAEILVDTEILGPDEALEEALKGLSKVNPTILDRFRLL